MVELGANVDQARDDGSCPLFFAAQDGHLEVVALLVKAGAVLDQTKPDGSTSCVGTRVHGATPLFVAAYKASRGSIVHSEIVKLLVEAGAKRSVSMPHMPFDANELLRNVIGAVTSVTDGAGAIHWGVTCDRSGMSPIVGDRYHLPGANFDLCAAEYNKLPEAERLTFVKVEPGFDNHPKEDDHEEGEDEDEDEDEQLAKALELSLQVEPLGSSGELLEPGVLGDVEVVEAHVSSLGEAASEEDDRVSAPVVSSGPVFNTSPTPSPPSNLR